MLVVLLIIATGIVAAILTIWYAVGSDLVVIPTLQSGEWSIRSNRVALAQLLLELEAIIVAGSSILYVWVMDRKKDREFRIYFLRSLLFEMRTNWAHICHRVPIDEGVIPKDFWDPRFQEFPMRDDACTYAVTEGQAKLRLSPELFQQLLAVSAAVRFVNHQTNEIFSFRFNSPEMLARISNLVRERSDGIELLINESSTLSKEVILYGRELAFRHWAIHYHGYTQHLGPALRRAIPAIEREIAWLEGQPVKSLPPLTELSYERLQYELPSKTTVKSKDNGQAAKTRNKRAAKTKQK